MSAQEVDDGNLSAPVAQAGDTHEFTLPEALALAAKMLGLGHLEAAEEICTLILQTWENHPEGLHIAGVLRHLQGRYDEALPLIAYALDQMPEHPRAYNSFGNTLAKLERLDEAAVAFRRALALGTDPIDQADAHNNLARVLRKQGDFNAAETEVRQSIALTPLAAPAWYNLSLILIRQNRVAEGIQANSKAIALWPRGQQPRDSVIRALVILGETQEAAKLYRDWLTEDPDNELVKHHLAACLNDDAPARASDAYVERVFDSFAKSFDSKLESLQYRAPEFVTEALKLAVGEPKAALDIADAGCGTDLCGPLVRPWARSLIGFDLSAGMLEKAAPREVYDALHKAELVQFLATNPGAFDVVISADTLCYFGELDGATRAAASALRAGGLFIYSVEALPAAATTGHSIMPSGRYAHARHYLESTLRHGGFDIASIEAVQLRMEAGNPVDGWVVTGRRSA